MPRKKKAPSPSPADAYFAPNPETAWIAEFMKKWGHNPVAFKRLIDSGKLLITPKSGAGFVPFKPNKQQQQLIDKVVENRRTGKPTRIILIKPRQGMGASTVCAAIFTAEAITNRATSSKVSAIHPDTMDDIFDAYRLMKASALDEIDPKSGGFRDDLERRRGARDNKRQIRIADTLSSVAIINAAVKQGANLGRGTAPKHWHGSECDFYPNFKKAMKSIMPALPVSPVSIAVLETTMDMEASTYFKDFVVRNAEKRADPNADHEGLWDVWFVSWLEVDYFRRPLNGTDLGPLSETESNLVKIGATPENLNWRRHEINAQFGGNEADFVEAYPATLDEALTVWGTSRFFYSEAEEFYRKYTIRQPESYWVMNSQAREPMREITDRDLDFYPHHVKVYAPPVAGRSYFIPADCADSEGRKTEVGSHNACVVLDEETGEQMAEIDASCPTYLFSDALEQLGLYYNIAELAPEDNADGSSVRMVLNSIRNYPKLYQMEERNGPILSHRQDYGFKTTKHSRREAIDALRFAFNTRRLIIRSEKSLKQIIERGRENFAKLETSDKEAGKFDDLAICWCIGCYMHGSAWKWRPKDPESLDAEKPKVQKSNKTLAKHQTLCYTIPPEEFDDLDSEAQRRFRSELNRT